MTQVILYSAIAWPHIPAKRPRKHKRPASADLLVLVVRDGVEPSTFHFSGGRSYQLSYLT